MLRLEKIVPPFVFNKRKKIDIKLQSEVITKTGFFDEDFYKKQYFERFGRNLTKSSALIHYLTSGVYKGLNPSNLFDSGWYLQNYPDVQASGINPLYHYLKYGEDEGRSPAPDQHDANGFTSPNLCNEKLWSGFSSLVLPKLEALSAHPVKGYRIQALWHLARWHYVHGNASKTLSFLQDLSNEQRIDKKKVVVSMAKCNLALGNISAIEDILRDDLKRQTAGDSLPYIVANSLSGKGTPAEKIWFEAVNSIYESFEVSPIGKLDAYAPLALENLGKSEVETATQKSHPVKVSVVIPAFNAAKTIHIALNSLLAQSWRNLEIVVVDDASSDNTQEIVLNYANKHEQIKYFRNDINLGAYPTRNRGVLLSAGDYITVHDSDDWSHPQKIEVQIAALMENPEIKCVLTNWVRVNDQLGFVGPWLLTEEFVEKNHSSTMVSREVLNEVGLWDPVNVAADTEFLWRVEKQYGEDTVTTVLPKVPFSFALALDNSLTQTKATHVKTIHYGLRRLYREAAAWWHESANNPLNLPSAGTRQFPCPLGNYRGAPADFNIVVVADFSDENERIGELVELIMSYRSKGSMVLFHWPDYRQSENCSISGRIFSLCLEQGISFTHSGHVLNAREVVFFDPELLDWVPDSLPLISGLKKVSLLPASQGTLENELIQKVTSIFSGKEPHSSK